MYKINFSKLTKMWKNLKNRDVLTNESKPKKGTKVKMIAEGIFQGEEEDMTKPQNDLKIEMKKLSFLLKKKLKKTLLLWNKKLLKLKKTLMLWKILPQWKKSLV